MIPSLPALHRAPYEFNWQMQSPWTGTWSGNGFVSSSGAATGAASAAESAAHATPTSAPHPHPHSNPATLSSFRPAPGIASHLHHTISFPDLARRDSRAHGRSFYRSYRRSPRLLPLLLVGGAGVWGYHKVKHHVCRLEDEIDRLEGKVAALQMGGVQGVPAPVDAKVEVAQVAPQVAEPAERERMHGHRWGWGHHGHKSDEQKQWEKSWGWGNGPEQGRV